MHVEASPEDEACMGYGRLAFFTLLLSGGGKSSFKYAISRGAALTVSPSG